MGNTVTQEQRDEYLSIAAEKGEAQTVDKWLKKGANPNTGLDDGDRKKRTSLHRAAKTKNNVDVLTKLLSCIKDVDATDDEGNTALHLAAGYYNNAAVVQTLLHAKPNCRIQNNKGQTALHSAIERGSDWKVVELLLVGDADPNISDFNGNSPLHLCAAKQGADEIVPGILLRFGANPNLKNEEGQTPLHVAAKAGNKIVLLLLKFHAKVRLRDKGGNKPSDLADVEEIRRILEFEERRLEERTTCTDSSPAYISHPVHHQHTYNYVNQNGKNYIRNGGVAPSGKNTYFWAGDIGKWKGYEGDCVIHLPDKSEIVVPPQAVPEGTRVKLAINPSPKSDLDNLPEFDFDHYDFEMDVKVEIPGAVLLPHWMKDSSFKSFANSPLAYTGFCAEGRNRWTSSREVTSQLNGALALHFKLMRNKGDAYIYKIPQMTRRSSTEIFLDRSTASNPTPSSQFINSSDKKKDSEDTRSVSSSFSEESEVLSELKSSQVSNTGFEANVNSRSSRSSSEEGYYASYEPRIECLTPEEKSPTEQGLPLFEEIQVVVGHSGVDCDVTEAETRQPTAAFDAITDFLKEKVESSNGLHNDTNEDHMIKKSDRESDVEPLHHEAFFVNETQSPKDLFESNEVKNYSSGDDVSDVESRLVETNVSGNHSKEDGRNLQTYEKINKNLTDNNFESINKRGTADATTEASTTIPDNDVTTTSAESKFCDSSTDSDHEDYIKNESEHENHDAKRYSLKNSNNRLAMSSSSSSDENDDEGRIVMQNDPGNHNYKLQAEADGPLSSSSSDEDNCKSRDIRNDVGGIDDTTNKKTIGKPAQNLSDSESNDETNAEKVLSILEEDIKKNQTQAREKSTETVPTYKVEDILLLQEDSRIQHPIDPALATIEEELSPAPKNRKEFKSPRYSSSSEERL